MEHAKKYVLVDPQMYRPTLPEKSLSELDKTIQQTLNSELPEAIYIGYMKKLSSIYRLYTDLKTMMRNPRRLK